MCSTLQGKSPKKHVSILIVEIDCVRLLSKEIIRTFILKII